MSKKTKPTMKLAIVVPTYNESKNVLKIIKQIKQSLRNSSVDCTVLFVDDNSPDGTGEIVQEQDTVLFHVRVLRRKNKEGLGKAYIHGFEEALKGDYTHIMQMDADLSHDPKYIPVFLLEAREADFVVGSRYIKGGATPDWSWYRKLLSRFGNNYARLFLGSKIHDYTGGYNIYSATLLKKVGLDTLHANGYGFLIELKYKALCNCRVIREIPIIFTDRLYGKSKLPLSTIFTNLFLVPQLAMERKVR